MNRAKNTIRKDKKEMKKTVKLLALCLALVMVFSLAACGTEPAAESDTPEVSGTPVASDNKYGGTITIRRSGTTVINPMQTSAVQIDKNVYGLFFESLLVTDENANVLPNLATGYTVSEDGLTITMELVENAVFFNGEPVNAEAVVATFNLYMDPEYQHILIDYITGLESVEAVDEYTVQFNFSSPNSDFPAAMTTPIGYIMAPSAIESYKSTGDNEVFAREGGCGPFIMTEFIDGESIKTVRNENYYKTDDEGNQLPYLDGVTVQLVSDESVMTQNMLSGDINSLDYFSGITTLAQLQNASNVTVKSLTCGYQYFLYMNMSKEPFDNELVREAMCYAVNFDEFNATFCSNEGLQSPTNIMSFQSFYKEFENYTYNPEKAKELLAEAGYPDGVEVELYYGTYGVMQQVCEMVQAQAKEAGFDIKLVGQDGAAIKSTWAVDNEDAPAGMRLQNNGTPKVTASISMDYIFGDTALQNCSKWHNSEFQTLLDSLTETFDADEQAAILGEMQELIYNDIPICTLFYAPNYTAYSNNLNGLYWDSDTACYYSEAWLSE